MVVTHDRWLARGCDRFLIFPADERVYEASEPVWEDIARTDRTPA